MIGYASKTTVVWDVGTGGCHITTYPSHVALGWYIAPIGSSIILPVQGSLKVISQSLIGLPKGSSTSMAQPLSSSAQVEGISRSRTSTSALRMSP